MRLALICNPVAGHGRARRTLNQLEANLRQKAVVFDLMLTEYPGHAEELASEVDLVAFDGMIAVGGDGTLFEVLNGYLKNPAGTRIPIGVVPMGTGNAVIREFDIDLSDWKSTIDIILRGRCRMVDVARVRSNEDLYHFVNILGIGFAANVTVTAQRLKVFGNVSYTIGVFLEAISLRPASYVIKIDGAGIERRAIFVEVSNTRFTSNFLMAPTARIDDGLLNITVLNKVSRRRLFRCFPKIFTGEHVQLDEVETFTAKHILIECEKHQRVSPDGEIRGVTPVEIECLPGAIEMFWP